jgi:hypothetical protein
MGDTTPATLPTYANTSSTTPNTSSTTTDTLPTTTDTLLGQAITPAPDQAQAQTQAQTNTSPDNTSFSNLATTENMTMLLGFLGVYFIIYFVLGKFYNNGENPSGFNMGLSRTLDMFFLVALGIITYSVYQSHQQTPDEGFFEGVVTKFANYINNPSSVFTTTAIIIMFYTFAYLFGIPMDSLTKPMFMSIIEGGAWLLLIIILFVDFFKYVLKISFYDLFPFFAPASTPKPDEAAAAPKPDTCKTEPTEDPKSEVFNIANNRYTYEDAQAICKAYDSTLATYDQIENAYNNGAEWCNYGWSAGQMILFPTQKATWEKLQKADENRGCAAVAGQQTSATPSNKNNCGRPGINGGYIANPYVRFGVNCFGKKPAATDADKVRMNAKQNQVYPKTPAEQVLENKVNYWKENADRLLQINSYSTNAWDKASSSAK